MATRILKHYNTAGNFMSSTFFSTSAAIDLKACKNIYTTSTPASKQLFLPSAQEISVVPEGDLQILLTSLLFYIFGKSKAGSLF